MSKSFEQIAKELDASREIITNGVDVLSKFIDKQAGQIADRDQRIAALEAQLEAQSVVANAYFDELAQWREMARQLEALRAKGWRVKLNWHQDGVWACFIEQVNGIIVTDRLVTQGPTLPAAVNAAYERVVGAGIVAIG